MRKGRRRSFRKQCLLQRPTSPERTAHGRSCHCPDPTGGGSMVSRPLLTAILLRFDCDTARGNSRSAGHSFVTIDSPDVRPPPPDVLGIPRVLGTKRSAQRGLFVENDEKMAGGEKPA